MSQCCNEAFVKGKHHTRNVVYNKRANQPDLPRLKEEKAEGRMCPQDTSSHLREGEDGLSLLYALSSTGCVLAVASVYPELCPRVRSLTWPGWRGGWGTYSTIQVLWEKAGAFSMETNLLLVHS